MTIEDLQPLPKRATIRVATDIGGTFTDIAAFDENSGKLRLGKTLSTPHALIDGIVTGVDKTGVSLSDAELFVHGTTVVINALLERKGARTALILTEGFRDIYEMGRGNRPDSYNLFFKKHKPLVERALRFVVRERILAGGAVHIALDEDSVLAVCDRLRAEGVESVGIILLHSYVNPAHEIRVKQIVQERLPEVFVSASHELSQEYREFERCSTVAANAYVGPHVQSYVSGIQEKLNNAAFRGSFFILQSSGGLIDPDRAKQQAVRLLESGPAGGIIGVKALCDAIGIKKAIGIDMGGTTAKAGVIHDGEALTSTKAMVGGYAQALPIQTSMIDIFEVGTGGGSIARAGTAGELRVGPDSAGAEPGPVCYALGGIEPSVTDANLVLGRLSADRFLGGEMKLDVDAAERAIRIKLADPLGLSVEDAASGVVSIATNAMANAVRTIATARGLDASSFDLVAYGGAGPLHAAGVMRELGMQSVIIPRAPGHFSAFGMLFSDLRADYVRTRPAALDAVSFADMEAAFGEDERRGHDALAAGGIAFTNVAVQRTLEMRYVGQEHAVNVSVPISLFSSQDRAAIKVRFDQQHELRYGSAVAEQPAEIVNLRTTVIGMLQPPPMERIEPAGKTEAHECRTGERPIYFSETRSYQSSAIYPRASLLAGHTFQGPAVIEEVASTTVVPPGYVLTVDPFGNLIIRHGNRRGRS